MKWNATAAYQQLLRLETMWDTYPMREREAAKRGARLMPAQVLIDAGIREKLRADDDGPYASATVQERIEESVQPLRDHAALVEANRQNEYAAKLWKANAEAGTHLTDREKNILSYLVECIANGSEQVTIDGVPVSELEALRLLYKLSK